MPLPQTRKLSPALLVAGIVVLSALSCSREPEQINGFWSYPWGTSYDTILADSADIQFRLGGDDFRLDRTPIRMTFYDVQFGMGYDQVVLDFTEDGRLWHGQARTRIVHEVTLDSVLTSLHDRYGGDTGERLIQRDSGYVTYWRTRSWIDRDFYSSTVRPQMSPETVKAIDLMYGGCPTDCPIYSIRVLADGEAYLWGIRGIDEEGGFRGRVDPEIFAALAAEATGADFLALADLYAYEETNLPTAGIRVDFGEYRRMSESLDGCGPPELESFIARADSLTAAIEWEQIVSWDTIRVFDQYRVNLDSLQTIGAALVR